jgi:hypothetical protein
MVTDRDILGVSRKGRGLRGPISASVVAGTGRVKGKPV